MQRKFFRFLVGDPPSSEQNWWKLVFWVFQGEKTNFSKVAQTEVWKFPKKIFFSYFVPLPNLVNMCSSYIISIYSNLIFHLYYSQCSPYPLVKGSNPGLMFIRLYWLLHRQTGILSLPSLTPPVSFTPTIKYLKVTVVKLDHHQFTRPGI